MLRKAVTLLLILAMLLGVGQFVAPRVAAFGTQAAHVSLFGQRVDGAVLFEGRSFVPVRAIWGLLGLNFEFDARSQTLLINSAMDNRTLTAPLPNYRNHAVVRVLVHHEQQKLAPPAINHRGTVFVPLRLLERMGVQVGWDMWTNTAFAGTLKADSLPRVGSNESLVRLLGNQTNNLKFDGRAAITAQEQTGSTDFSQTNVQVAGVDESDIAKTDGEFIYQIRGRELTVTRAYPVETLAVVSSVVFKDERFIPQEIFIDDTHLVVIGQADNNEFRTQQSAAPGAAVASLVMPRWWGNPTTRAYVYDLRDRANLKLLREVEIEGNRLAARKIGSVVYLLSTRWAQGPIVPHVRDSARGGEFLPISPSDIRYFPDRIAPSYLVVASFDLNRNAQPAEVTAYLGAGQEVYMSHQNIYVAVGDWQGDTVFHKFAVDGVKVTYAARGKVSGQILNQFSMDEYKGYFRTATTIWSGGQLSNAVFVLDSEMRIVGSILNIAPTERIYSARFMGDRGYMVTFVLVDPLFVIDLSNPRNPRILGELKIPGFSSYLHPLDDNHLLGIGRDTTVLTTRDINGRIINEVAIELGIKLTIFDITDVANPKEKHVAIIGGRGTYSEALSNHKALLFDQRNDILAIPITIHGPVAKPDFGHGPFEFQGALVLDVNLTTGFAERARISHLNIPATNRRPGTGQDGSSDVRRILYIGENFYVLSDSYITAHDGSSLREVQRVELTGTQP